MLRLVVPVLLVLTTASPVMAARVVVPTGTLAHRVLDGCPPGQVRDLMADCRRARPQRPPAGPSATGTSQAGSGLGNAGMAYQGQPTAGQRPGSTASGAASGAPSLSYGAMRPIPATPGARRPQAVCPVGFRDSPRSGQCRPDGPAF